MLPIMWRQLMRVIRNAALWVVKCKWCQYSLLASFAFAFYENPLLNISVQDGPKTDIHIYFWDNFGISAPILTILSLLQAQIYGA